MEEGARRGCLDVKEISSKVKKSYPFRTLVDIAIH